MSALKPPVTTKEKAQQIKKKFEFIEDGTELSRKDVEVCAIKYQKGIIKVLKDHDINSEYQNEVLNILKAEKNGN
jgi:hypothetical protein